MYPLLESESMINAFPVSDSNALVASYLTDLNNLLYLIVLDARKMMST